MVRWGGPAAKAKPVPKWPKPPPGYDEVGKTLAQPVTEGFRNRSWALEIAELLGYGSSDLDAWLAYYTKRNRTELKKRAAKAAKSREKIEHCQAEAKELLSQFDSILEQARTDHTPRKPWQQ